MIFAENNRISHRQLYRQIILNFTAPFLLCLFGFGKMAGITGITAVIAVSILLCFYVLFLIRQESCYVHLKKITGIWGERVICAFMVLYIIFTAAYLLNILGDVVTETLVMDFDKRWSIFWALLVCSFGTNKGMQRRGRVADVMGGIFLWIMVMILLLCIGQGNRLYLKEMLAESAWSTENFVKSGYVFLGAFSGISLLPFLLEYVEKSASAWKPVVAGIFTVSGIIISLLVLLPAIFGWNRLLLEEYPVLPLLAAANLPGNVLARFDILWLGFLLLGFLFSIGSLLHYGHLLLQKINRFVSFGKYVLFAAVFLLAVGNWSGYGIEAVYEMYLAYVFVPGMIFIQMLVYFVNKGKKKKRVSVAVCLLLVIFAGISFGGCGGIEPEKRMYPLALGVDFAEENYVLTYSMANLPEATGQEKPEEMGENTQILTIQGRDFKEIKTKYQQSQEKYLDMGHLEVLVVGPEILESNRWQELLLYLKEDSLIGENIYIFQTEEPEELLAWQNAAGTSLGEYVCGIMENRMSGQRKRGVTLREVYYQAAKDGTCCLFPWLCITEDYLEIQWTNQKESDLEEK